MRRLAGVAVVEFPPPVLQEGMLRRQRLAVIGNIVTVATEGIHGVNGIALGLRQKEKSIIKILGVLSRYLATVRICLLYVRVHAVLLVLPPAAMPPPTAKLRCFLWGARHILRGDVLSQILTTATTVCAAVAGRGRRARQLFCHDIFTQSP